MATRLPGGWISAECGAGVCKPGGAPAVADHQSLQTTSGATPRGPGLMTAGPPAAAAASMLSQADVAVIDGDDALRDRLGGLFRSVGWQALLFADTEGVLERGIASTVRCMLMDVRIRGHNGMDFHARMLAMNIHTPVVFITAHGDIPMCARAMKAGAVDFLAKPARDQDVLDAVGAALELDRRHRQAAQAVAVLRARADTLSPREAEIWMLVTAGLMNKQIAGQLGLSEVTVKMHRASLMRKMAANSVAELTRIAITLQMAHAPPEWMCADGLATGRPVELGARPLRLHAPLPYHPARALPAWPPGDL